MSVSSVVRKRRFAKLNAERRQSKSDRPADANAKFQRQAMSLAKEALSNAVLWLGKNELTWALVEANRAVKLLEIAR